MYYATTCPSPVGRLTLACDGENLVGLWVEGQKYFGGTIGETMIFKEDLELPLRPIGGAFRQGVWSLLCEIPYGEVVTYGGLSQKLAARLGKTTMSSQAVGGAVGHNPISIIIPCHRVVGAGGSLTGYAGGIDKKRRLLELEGVDTSRLFVPTKGTAL